jgi:carbon monoxide dehydrogenase subunit G
MPPEATVEFRAAATAAKLRELLADPSYVAGLIPQVVAVKPISPTTAQWTVLVKVGPISRKSEYSGELLEASDAGVRFRATGPEATIEGRLAFVPVAEDATEVRLTLTMTGQGALRAVVDAYLAKRVKPDADQFVRSLEARLTPAGAPST